MPSDGDAVRAYIAGITSATRRRDAETLLSLIQRVTGEHPRMWGSSIVGFGQYHYRYESGREGDGPAASFSARKPAISLYLTDGIGRHAGSLSKLGRHSTGVGCLYIKDLSDVDLRVLEEIVRESYETLTAGTYRHRARESQDVP
jgi:hypothetical protein